jgi:hypothetical protein
MKTLQMLKGLLIVLAILGMMIPAHLFALGPTSTQVKDVALQEGGVLVGQVVDPQGAVKANVPVSVSQEGQVVVETKSGADGYFAVKGLRGGVHQVAAAEGQGVYRLWVAGTAPPAAQEGILVVSGSDVTRGQAGGGGGLKTFLANPLVIAAIVATAVAVPLAIHNSHSSDPTSP